MMEHFKRASQILHTLQQQGFEAYFVGGSVRDHLMHRPIGDIDIATSALPEDVMRIFPKHVPVGLQHGTVVVMQEGVPYEVTTFRVEADYEDFRRPSAVTFVRSLEEDLKRRDFTMNAIAMKEDGTIVDPFQGQEAIGRQLIQTVGKAEERFREDALRMMRGVRFVSTLGFSLCPDTEHAIRANRHLLQHIAVERVAVEFGKLLLGPAVQEALVLLVGTGLYEYLPCFEQKREQLLQAARHDWMHVQTDIEAWAFIIWITETDDETVYKSWKLPNRKLKDTAAVLRALKQRLQTSWSALMLYEAGEETAVMAERLAAVITGGKSAEEEVRMLYRQLSIKRRQDLQVTGRDLLTWTERPAGPWVAERLAVIEQEVVCGSLANDREQIKEWLKQCNLL